jgi:HSP20 family protein
MALIKFNPNSVPSNYNTLFDSFFSDMDKVFGANHLHTSPAANIRKIENGFELELAVPGFKKEELDINVEKNVLTLSSNRAEEQTEDKGEWRRREFSYTSFKRSFTLPENVDEDNMKAEYEQGVLRLTIPVAQPVSKIKKIEIA